MPDSELEHWKRKLGIARPRFAPRHQPASDGSYLAIAVKNGTRLILADPRRSELARHATHFLQFIRTLTWRCSTP